MRDTPAPGVLKNAFRQLETQNGEPPGSPLASSVSDARFVRSYPPKDRQVGAGCVRAPPVLAPADRRANQELHPGVSARFSAGDFAHLPGAINTADWNAIGCGIPRDIEINCVASAVHELRIRE